MLTMLGAKSTPEQGSRSLFQTAALVALMSGIWGGMSHEARGAYDHSVLWTDMSALDLKEVLDSQYASYGNLLDPNMDPDAHDRALRDANERVGRDFRIPTGIKDSTAFWLRVYTEFTTQHVVLMDERHPELVYEVLDFRETARKITNPIVYELTVKKRIRATAERYRKALRRLAERPRGPFRSPEEKKVFELVKKLDHKHSFQQLARNLRTQTGQRDNIVKGLLAAEAYFPKMEDIFDQAGIPPELTRLSLVESSFNLNARSRVGASGVWQFMPITARKFLTLRPDQGIDERLSPLKSSVAAAKLLRENYQRFRSWPLAVTAYNHGLSGLPRLRRELAFAEIAYLFDPCNSRSRLGWAGRNYYSEFLAILHAVAYRDVFYGIPPTPSLRPIFYKRLSERKTGMLVAMENGVSVREFIRLNPDIDDVRSFLPANFMVALPSDHEDLSPLLAATPKSPKSSKKTKLQAKRPSKKRNSNS